MTRPKTPILDPAQILAVLAKHRVRYIVVGGYAAMIHRIPIMPTTDIDITPERSNANLKRLVAALEELNATNLVPEAHGSPQPPFFAAPAQILGRRFWTLVTPYGALDLVISPDGFPGGYSDLEEHSRVAAAVQVDGTQLALDVRVASARAIYRSKKAAGRPKDVKALRVLGEAVRRELLQPPNRDD